MRWFIPSGVHDLLLVQCVHLFELGDVSVERDATAD